MYEQISAMFMDPKIQEAAKQRLLEGLQGADPKQQRMQAIADALRAAGKSMATTPGDLLSGLAAASGAGADAYAAGQQPSGDGGKLALSLIDKVTNAQKAQDMSQYRQSETERRSEADAARREANNRRIGALERRLEITDAFNRGRLAQGDKRIAQGDQRLEQGQQRIDDQKAYRERTAAISEKNAETARMNAERIRGGRGADPRKIQIDAAEHLRKARESIYSGINEFSTPEEKTAAEQQFAAYKSEFETNLSAAGGGSQQPQKITDKAGYDALPSGTRFIAPDGSIRIKP
jgi:hypothetical protein